MEQYIDVLRRYCDKHLWFMNSGTNLICLEQRDGGGSGKPSTVAYRYCTVLYRAAVQFLQHGKPSTAPTLQKFERVNPSTVLYCGAQWGFQSHF